MTIAKSTTAQRNAVRPYCKDLRPSKSEADWAKGMAQMSATEKGKLETTIRKFECQLLAYKNALKAHGEEAYEAARTDAKARMKEVKDLKLDYSSDEDDLSDYGGDDGGDEDETAETPANPAGSAAKGKPAKEKQAGGRMKGFASKSAYIFFNADFQKQVKEKPEFREAMMAAHNWDGSFSKGATTGSKVTIMSVQGKEWVKFKEELQDADDAVRAPAEARMKIFEELAAASKKECDEALEKYKALLTTDAKAAEAFKAERAKKA